MDIWWSSIMALSMFCHAYLPPELANWLHRLFAKVIAYILNNVYMTVEEFSDGGTANELFVSVQLYLTALTTSSSMKRMNAVLLKNSSKLTLGMGKWEYIWDSYQGITLRWNFITAYQKPRAASTYVWLQPAQQEKEEVRKFVLRIHRRHRSTHLQPYLNHITELAKDMARQNKQRSLYTNVTKSSYRSKHWLPVPFKHPASFQTLALDSKLKRSIIDDLTQFAKGGEFYKHAGRAWKRGYLLYGPPGTGKTTLVAAIANLLEYDVYDLELTQVKSNSELRDLLLSTQDKSVIVIEDIDCSLDLSERDKKKKLAAEEPKPLNSEEEKNMKVTLSGLLNFTDGILSCCSRERIIVFTTNHVEKLDPALLRPGRMDMHIHLSFCTFEGVKVLACNYLQIEDHPLFPAIELAIAGANMAPAAVSEVLTTHRRNPDAALQALLLALEEKKKNPPLSSPKAEEDDEEEKAYDNKKSKETENGVAIANGTEEVDNHGSGEK